ncbi:MAG: phosphatase PAP2 family protein [Bacteroidota bacterium]
MRLFLQLLALLIFIPTTQAQLRVDPYDTNGDSEWAYLGVGVGLNLAAKLIGNRTPIFSDEEVGLLDFNRILPIDRYSTRHFSHSAAVTSDRLLLAAFVSPFFLFLDKPARDNGGDVGLVLFQGALINAGIVNLTKVLSRRARPYNYNPDVPLEFKRTRNARYSFPSGHVATSAFFALSTAKIFNDLYPESNARPYVWAGMSLIPLAVSYGRMRGGRHFFTDVLVGFAVGTSVALLVPELHKD